MKSISFLLVFCIACASPSFTKQVSDRERDGFLSPVKLVSVTWSPVSGDANVPAGARCRQLTNAYDADGRLMRHSTYPGTCGGDEMREDCTYSQDGSRTTKTQELRGKDSPPRPPAAAGSNPEGIIEIREWYSSMTRQAG